MRLRRGHPWKDLEDDIQDHIERETQENIECGLSPEEARYTALRKFGNRTRVMEEARNVWISLWLENLIQDFRVAVRMLIKRPGFAVSAVLTLALGVGVNTSIFSLVYSMMFRSLPVKDPGNVVSVYEQLHGHYSRGVYGQPNLLSYPEYQNYRDNNQAFSGLAAYADVSLSLSGANKQAIAGLLASCNYFGVLGGEIARGRGLLSDDCSKPDAVAVAVISYRFWTAHFASDAAVLGTTLLLNQHAYTIVGITADSFAGAELQVPDVWVPLTMAPQLLPNDFANRNWLSLGSVGWLNAVGRLKPGISRERAAAELNFLARRTDANYPGQQTTVVVNSGAFWNSPEMRQVGTWMAIAVFGLAGIILGIACMNVMTLLVTRSTMRYREIGVRLALGASRTQLVRQLLTEIAVLSALGGPLSVIVASWVPRLLLPAVPEMPVSPDINLTPDSAILAYAFLASLVATAVCGLAPALQATKPAIVAALTERGGSSASGPGRSRLRSLLIVAQVAGCSMLLIVAGLLVRGLHRAQSTSPGFTTANVLLVSLDLANKGYDDVRAAAFERTLRDRLGALPGVTGVALAGVIPGEASNVTSVTVPGGKTDTGSITVWQNVVSASYFQTMRVPLLRGRTFTEQDEQSQKEQGGGAAPAVISVAMAQTLWGQTDPVGKQFVSGKKAFQVVGMVPDVQNVHLGQTDGPFFYAATSSDNALDSKILVRTAGSLSVLEKQVSQMVRRIDPSVMVSIETFDHSLEKILKPSKTMALLIGVLGVLAMAVAMTGVGGVVAYNASQRTQEIGIRKALGANGKDISALLLTKEAKLAAFGLAIGIMAGGGAAQLLAGAGLLFGLSALDSATYLTTTAAFIIITMLACYLPARKAMQTDPMVALRYE